MVPGSLLVQQGKKGGLGLTLVVGATAFTRLVQGTYRKGYEELGEPQNTWQRLYLWYPADPEPWRLLTWYGGSCVMGWALGSSPS